MALWGTTQILTGIKNWVLGKIANITALIPSAATAQNQLADKAFVNSSIATATATYRGNYNLVSDLGLTVSATTAQVATALAAVMQSLSITPDNNDYCFVRIPTANDKPTEIARIDRYKFNGTAWGYEYSLNNSGYTASQWAAINSGITSGLVTKLNGLPTGTELSDELNNRYTKAEIDAELEDTPEFVEEDPASTDLIDQYAQILQDLYQALTDAQLVTENAKADYVGEDNYVYHWSSAQHKYVKTNLYVKGDPGTTDYNELQNKPTIPTSLAQLSSDTNHRTVSDAEKDAWAGKQNPATTLAGYGITDAYTKETTRQKLQGEGNATESGQSDTLYEAGKDPIFYAGLFGTNIGTYEEALAAMNAELDKLHETHSPRDHKYVDYRGVTRGIPNGLSHINLFGDHIYFIQSVHSYENDRWGQIFFDAKINNNGKLIPGDSVVYRTCDGGTWSAYQKLVTPSDIPNDLEFVEDNTETWPF